ncbi:MAG: delta-60 repeat domain-containing protein [Planctomycetes bacterium]|nr:delta-60 repeat domain-containing protein [Planctomycetota bacterium]MCW8135933.1 delta-60 repeat domain-containing protein [Planctomycetota bacterium]
MNARLVATLVAGLIVLLSCPAHGAGTVTPYFNATLDSNVMAIAVQSDLKVVIGGAFTQVGTTGRSYIARLTTTGALDTTFDPGTGADNGVNSIVIQADGKILIGGAFQNYNTVARSRVARLNADGSLDTTFDPGTGPNGTIQKLRLQSDGKVLIAGTFDTVGTTACANIARLNSDGTLDTTFDTGLGPSATVTDFQQQSDGKVVIVGYFTDVGTTSRGRVARLNADGSLDTTFATGTAADAYVTAIVPNGLGEFWIAGNFSTYDGTNSRRVARISGTNGDLVRAVDAANGPTGVVHCLLPRNFGVIIGGAFPMVGTSTLPRLAFISSTGRVESSYAYGTGPNGNVLAIALSEGGGSMYIGGAFTMVNTEPRTHIAQLNFPPSGGGGGGGGGSDDTGCSTSASGHQFTFSGVFALTAVWFALRRRRTV